MDLIKHLVVQVCGVWTVGYLSSVLVRSKDQHNYDWDDF